MSNTLLIFVTVIDSSAIDSENGIYVFAAKQKATNRMPPGCKAGNIPMIQDQGQGPFGNSREFTGIAEPKIPGGNSREFLKFWRELRGI